MSEEIISDNGKERLKKRSGNMFKRKKELSWRKKKAAMKQFREDILLEQLIRKPEVSNALVADTNDVGMNKIRNNGKFVMLSIALPGSILNNAQSPELRTYLAGQIARSAAVFCIDEIIVYDETARMKSQQREDYCNGQWYPDLPVHSGNVECNFHLAKILEFMECPQYLRKTLFPLQKTLKYAGILNPLDCPHHLRASDLSVPYREGVVLDKPIKAGRGPICNVGLYKEVQINEDVTLKTGTRVTVKILDIYSGIRISSRFHEPKKDEAISEFCPVFGLGSFNVLLKTAGIRIINEGNKWDISRRNVVKIFLPAERKRYHGCLVNSKQIKQEAGLYWGYKVRLALSLYDALNAEEYDVIIGTSERGKPVSKFEMPFSGKNRILIVFGGLEGLETAVEADKNISCSTPEELFEHYLNVVPGQGSRIIRTEEAIPITLATLRPMIFFPCWRDDVLLSTFANLFNRNGQVLGIMHIIALGNAYPRYLVTHFCRFIRGRFHINQLADLIISKPNYNVMVLVVGRYNIFGNTLRRGYATASVNDTKQGVPKFTLRYFYKLFKWMTVGFVAGSSTIFLYNLFVPDLRELQDEKHYYSDWKLRAYSSLPLNTLSRFAGGLAKVYIPVWLRPKIFNIYVRVYDCRMDEAEVNDLSAYPTLAAFFNRSLKPTVRPISDADLVSPADGVVIHYGKVKEGRVEFVKGHDYDITEFLGPLNIKNKKVNFMKDTSFIKWFFISLLAIITDFMLLQSGWQMRKYIFPARLLLSVRPTFLYRMPHLFCINERVVLKGSWKHGFFSLCAVAATNVGDVSIDADPLLHTNIKRLRKEISKAVPIIAELEHAYRPGDKVGEFRLGSTIVLIFEAPSTVQFAVRAGDNLRYGQSLVVNGF
ncbi:unnamed protein product [Brugia pahangi]|uniref:phosphatidylserine decarboxylase n=1 Tax=Brugia pahangi TaxID=6280 RepID=A0A0N4TJE1_BRUPA|nr:unnamed protein product [Brugia pahangi]